MTSCARSSAAPISPPAASSPAATASDSYLRTGRGIVRIRGKAHTEELKGGMEQIVITEIPYNVNRSNLVTRIAELVGEKQIEGIRDLRDESDENTRIVIELKRGEQSRVVINQLFQKTALESSFGVNLLALDKKRPKQMNIKELIECYIEHRRDVITRRTQFRLREAEDRAHILEGYKIALDNLDDFVRIIRASSNREEAKEKLMAKYPLSERQTDAILELRLYQLTGLERDKIEAEYLELIKLIEELRSILESPEKLNGIIKTELLEMKAKYTSARRTEIIGSLGEFRMEDVIPNEGCVITVSHLGFIKRTPSPNTVRRSAAARGSSAPRRTRTTLSSGSSPPAPTTTSCSSRTRVVVSRTRCTTSPRAPAPPRASRSPRSCG